MHTHGTTVSDSLIMPPPVLSVAFASGPETRTVYVYVVIPKTPVADAIATTQIQGQAKRPSQPGAFLSPWRQIPPRLVLLRCSPPSTRGGGGGGKQLAVPTHQTKLHNLPHPLLGFSLCLVRPQKGKSRREQKPSSSGGKGSSTSCAAAIPQLLQTATS